MNAQKVTFRAILNDYLKTAHWSRLGINILLASRIDKEMTDNEAMFLPDMLFAGMKRSTYHQRVIVSEIATLNKGADKIKAGPNQPLWVMMGVLLLTLLIFFVKPLHRLKAVWAFILLLVSGLLGFFLLFMWFGTDHNACGNNYNLLWAFPLNLLAAFTIFRPRKWHVSYGLLAVGLLLIALLVHAIGLQVMPLIEILPFLISLLYCYMFIYKRALALRTA
jgi:peptidoglycan/LPS O-acetylase OafA/YrhL